MTKRLILALLLSCSPVWATTYYVDNSCANNGNGLATSCAASSGGAGPFNSIANAQSRVTGSQAGNSVLLKAGETFREMYTVPAYGTSGDPFTIGAYGTGANATISGSDVGSNWTLVTGSVFRSSVSWTPVDLFQDGGHLTFVTFNANCSTTASAMSAGTWSYGGGELCVWATDGANPSTHIVEIPHRTQCIAGNSEPYVTYENLTLVYSANNGIDTFGSYDIVRNSLAYSNYNYGFRINGTGVTFDSLTAYDCNVGIGGYSGTDDVVEHCTSHDNTHITNSDGFNFSTVSGLLLQYNLSYNNNNGPSSDGYQIAVGEHSTVRYNTAYNNQNCNIILSTGSASYGSIYGNVLYGSTTRGICVDADSGPTYVYNNTIVNTSASTQYALRLGEVSNGGTLTAMNNVVYSAKYPLSLASGTQSAFTADYNIYYQSSGGNAVQYNGRGYTCTEFSIYQSTSGQDAHSSCVNPQLANLGASRFWLASGSPGIDAGLNLGSPYNIGLMPGSTWPNSVVTGDQNAYGSGWEIGAFIYVPAVPPPTNLQAVAH
jgi:hypothetical protein